MEYRDYYATLGVPRTATQAEIKKSFRTLARAHHPDVNAADATAAEARFKEINEAYDVLGDPEKRKRYDALGADWERHRDAARRGGPGAGSAGGPFAGADGFPGGVRYEFRGRPEDIGGFSDFFRAFFAGGPPDTEAAGGGRRGGRGRRGGAEDLFGGRGGPGGEPQPRALSGELEVGLEEIAAGATTRVAVDGRRLDVTIPAGIEDGKRIRLAGRDGEPDLLLAVRARPHPVFTRDGADLHRELPITLAEALLGGEVPVGTIAGKTLLLTIPPGTQSGRTFLLRGHGLPRFRAEGRGDLRVKVRVVLPDALDPEGRRLARALADHIAQPDPRTGTPLSPAGTPG